MRLATGAEVLTLLTLDSTNVANLNSANAALDTATVHLENILGSSLAASDRIDYFDYNPTSFDYYRPFIVNLSAGYVDRDSIRVYESRTTAALASVSSTVALQLDKAKYFIKDAEAGTLTIGSQPPHGYATFAVKYSAGYAVDTNDIAVGSPDWMKQAAIAAAIRTLRTDSTLFQKKDIQAKSVVIEREFSGLLNSHIKTRMSGLDPSYTQDVT